MRSVLRAAPTLTITAATALLAICHSRYALADDELSVHWGAKIQSDLRFRTETKGVGDFYNRLELPAGPERNQNRLGLDVNASYGRFKAVGQVDFVLDGFAQSLNDVGDLYHIEKTDPYYFEVPSLYVDMKGILVDGLDLRIGQQVVSWGVGDQFNPTNNLNADDLRDPLLFGKQAGNFMVKADYWVNDNISISGVLVPVFKPALLPRSAILGPAAIERLPFADPALRWRIESEQGASALALKYPTIVSATKPVLPETNFENMQWAYRMAGTFGGQDIALSYYYGRHDFPTPIANHTRLEAGQQCDPKDKTRCIDGLLKTDVTLGYPKMHVYGLNAAGEIPLQWIKESLHGIGYRLEAALVFPDRTDIALTQDALPLPGLPQDAGEYDYDGDGKPGAKNGQRPAVVDRTPFLKWVVGLDYSIGEHVYLNGQWVHGLSDEFGAGDFLHEGYVVRQSGITDKDPYDTLLNCALPKDGTKCTREMLHPRLGDYAVLGMDFKFMNDALLLRLFNILDVSGVVEEHYDAKAKKRVRTSYSPFSEEGFSMVVYPEANYNFGNGLDWSVGALVQLGKDYSKFGSAEAGGTFVWTRGRFAF
ncbi:MAG: hypothetical protein U0441_27525 [Polyangiaceae bacterium]